MTTVLGFDTATSDTAVAVTAGSDVVAESNTGPDSATGRPAHATVLLVEIERAVDAAGGWERVDRLAVGLGPGSFTGLRVGIAAARALAVARALDVVGVTTAASSARASPPSRCSTHAEARRSRPFMTAMAKRSGRRSSRAPRPSQSALPRPLWSRWRQATARYDFAVSSRTRERSSPTTAIRSTG